MTTNVQAGDVATLTVRATLSNPEAIGGDAWIVIEDAQDLLSGEVDVVETDTTHFSVTAHTVPTLSTGHHRGTFQVHICKDSGCVAEWVAASPLPYDIDVEPAPLAATPQNASTATVARDGAVAAPLTIAVTGAGLQWSVSTETPWLHVEDGSTHSDSASIDVRFVPAGLAVGDYAGQVAVRSTDGQSVALPVTLHVIAPQFELTGGVPTFTAVNGAPIAAQTLSFDLDNGQASPWTLVDDAAWLQVGALSGTTPATVSLQPDASRGALASGDYDANLTLSSPGVADKVVTSHLTLVKPTLTPSVAAITLGGPMGRDVSPKSMTVSIDAGVSILPLKATAPDAVNVVLVKSSGSNVASATLSANAALATPGSTSATVLFSQTVNGDTVTAPVTVNVNTDQHRLLPSTWGVGLASSPTGSVLTRSLTIRDNFGVSTAWSATSDSPWLAVTASGNTAAASTLVLTADPASLPDGVTSIATVTIATTAAGVAPARVRVGLWKDAAGLVSTIKLPGTTVAHIVADRIRPLVYTNSGGTGISVYNAYAGTRVATIAGVGASLGDMAVSPDGSLLYVLDTSNRTMKVVDLGTLARIGTWDLDNAVSQTTKLLAIRPNGVEVVLVGDDTGTAYAAGRSLGATGMVGRLVATDDGQTVYNVSKRAVDYSAIADGVLTSSVLGYGPGGDDIALAGDGSKLYTATGSPYRCEAYAFTDLSLLGDLPGGDAYPNNVEVTSDGRAICGISGWYSVADFWVHSPAGAIVGSYKVAGYAQALLPGALVVTPDGMVVIAPTDDPLLAFVPIGR